MLIPLINLGDYIERVKKYVKLPIAIGFGISKPEQVHQVAKLGEGVVVGSQIIKAITDAKEGQHGEAAKKIVEYLLADVQDVHLPAALVEENNLKTTQEKKVNASTLPASFGEFGGRYAPETLMNALEELEEAYLRLKARQASQQTLTAVCHLR